jgi:type I restriction enzyme M protein
MQILRGALDQEELLHFALQLVAWVRLSRLGVLSGELAFNAQNLPRGVSQVTDIFEQLSDVSQADIFDQPSKTDVLGKNSMAFGYVNPAVQHLSVGQLLQALEALAAANLTDTWQFDDLIAFSNEKASRGFIGLPIEVAELMIALAQISSGDKVYLPFEHGFQLTTCAQKKTKQTFSETQVVTSFPWLINLLCDLEANIAISDSLVKPAFLDEGRLTQFPVSVSCPPFNARYSQNLAEGDRFARFPEATTSGGVLAVRHLLARTRGRIVVAVPNGLLFTPGAERTLRDDILAKKQVEAVVALPPALLGGSAVQFSLLILRTDITCNDILFVDGGNETLYVKDSRNKATLTGWHSIVEVVLKRENGAFSSLVTTEEVIANNSQLEVTRYCKKPDDDLVEQILRKYQIKALGEIVSIIRPIPLSQADGVVTVSEVAPADFPAYGYVTRSGREIKLTEKHSISSERSYLRPFDILLTIKGSVGKVAILPENTPENAWVMGQSCIVLRINDKSSSIDPRVIFSFLKSEVGQLQFRSLSTGSAVPHIQVRELEKIRLPVPTVEEGQVIVAKFEKLAAIECAIAQYRQEQEQIVNSIWVA